MAFTFNEEHHCYELDGKPLPSVTRILKPLYDFSMIHPDVLRRAADYGTAVHKTVELYLKEDLDEDSLDENLYNPLLAFKAWQFDHCEFCEELLSVEQPAYHAKLKYAGTPDLTCTNAVIDIKSRKVNMSTDPIQLAAYDNFGSGKRKRYVLELKQDASYVFTELPVKGQFEKFRYLLEYYNMTKEIERWKTK